MIEKKRHNLYAFFLYLNLSVNIKIGFSISINQSYISITSFHHSFRIGLHNAIKTSSSFVKAAKANTNTGL